MVTSSIFFKENNCSWATFLDEDLLNQSFQRTWLGPVITLQDQERRLQLRSKYLRNVTIISDKKAVPKCMRILWFKLRLVGLHSDWQQKHLFAGGKIWKTRWQTFSLAGEKGYRLPNVVILNMWLRSTAATATPPLLCHSAPIFSGAFLGIPPGPLWMRAHHPPGYPPCFALWGKFVLSDFQVFPGVI